MIFTKKHSNIFRKNGFTSLQAAMDRQDFTFGEIADMINESKTLVQNCFCARYNNRAGWMVIIKVGELLGVDRARYIKPELIGNLPGEVEEYIKILVGAKVTYPKATTKKRGRKRVAVTDEEIIEMTNAGMSIIEMAKKVKCGVSTISRIKSRLGLVGTPESRGRLPLRKKEEVIDMAKRGVSYRDISKNTGIAKGSIGGIIAAYRKTHNDLPLNPKYPAQTKTGVPDLKKWALKTIPATEPLSKEAPCIAKQQPHPNEWAIDAVKNLSNISEIAVKTDTFTATFTKGA